MVFYNTAAKNSVNINAISNNLRMEKVKIGIFFGGMSREREISYLGGKTAFEHIDKTLFEPVPIFVDSLGNFILINPEYLYEDSIRSFYPSKNQNNGYRIYIESLGQLNETQLYKLIYKIGKQVKLEDLKNHIDFAFVIMHGPYSEDGNIQGILEWYGIPYMGPGIMGSAVGIDKPLQNKLLSLATGQQKKQRTISKKEWINSEKSSLFTELINTIGFPFVVKAPHQGSSIGVAIVKKRSLEEFTKSMNQCFFETTFFKKDWDKLSLRQKKNFMEKTSNLDEGIGFPVIADGKIVYHPSELLKVIDAQLLINEKFTISSYNAEDYILIEEFTVGQEFSCGVIQDDTGKAFALPATEIYGEIQTFDFKSKYQSNVTKKRIPVETNYDNLNKISENILKAFEITGMSVVCRIDGFLTPNDEVILHDPNTIPGMSPASLIFKQMAEIGLNITNSISYMIRQSVRERIRTGKSTFVFTELLNKIDNLIELSKNKERKKVAVVFGENELEYINAQKKYASLSASEEYEPTCVCAAANGHLYKIPLNLMTKPNIQEFGEAVSKKRHPFISGIIEKTSHIRTKYVNNIDFEVTKYEEGQMAKEMDFVYHAKSGEMLAL